MEIFIKIINFSIILLIVILFHFAFAGTIENVDGNVMYKTASSEYAKDCWVWLDINNDSVKECYRFDEMGI